MISDRVTVVWFGLVLALVGSSWAPAASPQARSDRPSAEKEQVRKIEPERTGFRALTLGNPNYFGNLKKSPFKAVKTMIANTKYEEIECVGFNPDFDRLEAVVLIKKTYGYGGGICSGGSPEFVRFYLSHDNGSTWLDQGVVSFTAWNVQSDKPLEYAATLQIEPDKTFCTSENLPAVRAILSWSDPPPADQPDWSPVWGDVHEARIQIGSRRLLVVKDFLKEMKFKLPLEYETIFDLDQEIAVEKAAPLSSFELHAMYKDKFVEPHRYLYKDLHPLVLAPKPGPTLSLPDSKGYLQELKVDWAKVIGSLQKIDGDTKYEELTCVGLNTDLDTLVGILTVKLPSGYSGKLCTPGSTEYVAFWMDWGSGWQHVGTGAVRVHDLAAIPTGGLQYAAHVPVDVAALRQPCQKGPVTVKVRAILSWQVAPPSSNPSWVPKWGNRRETLVHIPAGNLLGTAPAPEFYTVGGMSPNDIGPATGLANGPAVTAGFTAHDSPFGAKVFLAGKIHNAPDLSAGATSLKYQVSVRSLPGGSWTPLNDDLKLKLIPWPGGIGSEYTVTLSAPDGWFEYRADHDGPVTTDINGDILAIWDTGSKAGKWQLKIDAKDAADTVYPGTQLVTVQLDNVGPASAVAITSGGGNCADFTIGDVIEGTYSGTDDHFNFLRLTVAPWLGGTGFIAPSPASVASPQIPVTRAYPTVPTAGESGIWKLDTTGMPRCGYVVYLHVWDRTIVNSGHIGRRTSAPVGLCLREAALTPGG